MPATGKPGFLRALIAVAIIVLLFSLPTDAGSAAGPITTPTSAVRSGPQPLDRRLRQRDLVDRERGKHLVPCRDAHPTGIAARLAHLRGFLAWPGRSCA